MILRKMLSQWLVIQFQSLIKKICFIQGKETQNRTEIKIISISNYEMKKITVDKIEHSQVIIKAYKYKSFK